MVTILLCQDPAPAGGGGVIPVCISQAERQHRGVHRQKINSFSIKTNSLFHEKLKCSVLLRHLKDLLKLSFKKNTI